MEGRFAVAVHRRRESRFELYADHFGCQPVFYARHGGALIVSTQLAAFVRLGLGRGLDREWLHRFLFFGYWPGTPTFLEGVRRLGPGSVLEFEPGSGELAVTAYEERLGSTGPLMGDDAVEHALDVFRTSVPSMFATPNHVVFALSGGLDSRTLYAFMPEGTDHSGFTYGMKGCHDQKEAAVTAKRLGMPHRQMFFDDDHVRSLPRLVYETVWLSGGLAWINRCMLPAVYRFVGAASDETPVLSSGIALDTLFRGHNNARGDVDRVLRTGEPSFGDPAYGELLAGGTESFRRDVSGCIEELNAEHGVLSGSEAYLSYTAYTLCPSYFTADLEIGGHYASLRVPGYDSRIVRLAYEIEYSTIYLSKFLEHDRFQEFILQANLMASHPRLAGVPLQGIPLDVFVKRDKLRYHAHRTLKHGWRYLERRLSRRGTATPIEDWGAWFGTVLDDDMRAVLGPGALVRDIVDPLTVDRYLAENRWPWLARLASVEIVLQLMENGWSLEGLDYPGLR